MAGFRGVVLVLLAVSTGCWQSRQGPAPPDLTEQVREIDATALRLVRIGETVDDELADLAARTETFFGTSASVWRKPFPLDAFKHTAMSCLNAPYNEAEPEPIVREAAERLGISCAVPAALDLENQLVRAPSQKAPALEKLREIDQVRNVRAQLQTRLRQLPSILRRTRAFVSSRRAEARQMVKNIQSRQSEYGRKSYAEAMAQIERYEEQLAALEREIDELESASGRWSKDLGSIVDRLYKDLSRLGRS